MVLKRFQIGASRTLSKRVLGLSMAIALGLPLAVAAEPAATDGALADSRAHELVARMTQDEKIQMGSCLTRDTSPSNKPTNDSMACYVIDFKGPRPSFQNKKEVSARPLEKVDVHHKIDSWLNKNSRLQAVSLLETAERQSEIDGPTFRGMSRWRPSTK